MEHSFLISSEVLYSTSVQNYIVYDIRYTYTQRVYLPYFYFFACHNYSIYRPHTSTLMMEQPDRTLNKDDTTSIGGINNSLIIDGATRGSDVFDTGTCSSVNIVREWEESI